MPDTGTYPTGTSLREADVVIIGAGPVGAVLALELARHGAPCVVIEKSTGASRHPKMDFVNARSMELLRRLGITDEIRGMGVPGDQDLNFLWTLGFGEEPIAEWTFPSVDELYRQMAKTNDGTMPCEPYQRVIGSLLEDLGRRRCRGHDLVDLREGWSFEGLTQDGDAVIADVVEVATGRREQLRTRYLVACDGAGSAVRQGLGIEVEQIGPVSQNCNVYFRSSDPALTRHGRFFLAVSTLGLTLVSRDGTDTWTGVFPVADGERFDSDPGPVLRKGLGVDFEIDEVISVANWENRLGVARTFRAGRVFLTGDSAHQYFPSGGYGANTGIADAVDLGWKLAAVIRGWAGDGLLDSYEAERRPVALFNREMCFNLMEVWRRFMLLTMMHTSRAQLAGFLNDQRHLNNSFGIQFGYRYNGSPVVAHEPDTAEPVWDPRRIVPTTWPGGRAPSVRLAGGDELFDALGTEFTLVDLSGTNAGAPLADAAVRAGIPVTYLVVDDPDVRSVWERDLVLLRPDQHVAWRGDLVPEDCAALLALVSGH